MEAIVYNCRRFACLFLLKSSSHEPLISLFIYSADPSRVSTLCRHCLVLVCIPMGTIWTNISVLKDLCNTEKQMVSKINKICSEIIRPMKMNKARWMGVGHSRRGQAGVSDFYFIDFFLMWAIFKVFIEFVTILLLFLFFCFFFFFFWLRGIWDLRSLTRNWQAPPVLERKVLTTELPGKSWAISY